MKHIFTIMLVLFLSFNLFGCEQTDDAQYNEYIQSGLDYLALEEYTRAEIKFEQALSIKPEDDRASAYMLQSNHFNNALRAVGNGEYELAITEANHVLGEENGSQALMEKAGLLIKELGNDYPIETTEESETVTEEEDVSENNKEDVEEVESSVVEEVISDKADKAEEAYPYEEIEGYYAFFEGEAHNSSILATIIIEEERFIEIIPSWNEILIYFITSKSIVNDTFNIDYEPEYKDDNIQQLEPSSMSAVIQKSDHSITSLLTNGNVFHKLTADEIAGYGMELPSHLRNDN